MQLSEIITLSLKALKKLTKTGIIALFLKLREALLLKEKEIKKLIEKVKYLEQQIDKKKQKEVNKTSNQPSSKKPEWEA